jgi:pseudouridine-5'-phosphate glycosidase
MSVKVAEEVRCALDAGQPVVALETAVLTTGLPRCTWNDSYGEPPEGTDVTSPINAGIAKAMTEIIRSNGAIPAWIGVLRGELIVGLSQDEVLQLACDEHATKVSIANCASTMMRGGSAGTTVAATLTACRLSSEPNPIRVFATGGIGGIHQNWSSRLDISADLTTLATTQTCVVASGAKSILDLYATVESLETIGVPVLGIGHNTFPRFVERSSDDDPTIQQVDKMKDIVSLCTTHWNTLGFRSSVLATTQVPDDVAIDRDSYQQAIEEAEKGWIDSGQHPTTRTPYLLHQLAKATCGRSLVANLGLLCHNALIASKIANAMQEVHR